MTAADYILEGLYEALQLERELGTLTVECDRRLLSSPAEAKVAAAAPPPQSSAAKAPPVRAAAVAPAKAPVRDRAPAHEEADSPALKNIVFLHDRPLGEAGCEMMAKIVAALGETPESSPLVWQTPIPAGRVYVVLGGLALKKWLPGVAAAPGQWVKSARGSDMFVTYSPAYLLRFGEVTPAVRKMKESMWIGLKGVLQHLRASRR